MEQRWLYDELVRHLDSNKHTIIVGPRQTGKTTLLKQLKDYCTSKKMPTCYLSIEHKDIKNELDKNPDNLFLFCPNTEERIYVFLDEIQNLNDPSNFLKQLYDDYEDKNRIKLIVTGSSAFYIDERFNDSLAGRKKVFTLLTCSFSEYLLIGGKSDLLEEFNRIHHLPNAKSGLLSEFQREYYEYMRFGGYPEIITEKNEGDKIEMLKDLRDSFVKKDIEEAGIKDVDSFYRLFQILAIQTGGLTNVNELSKSLRVKNETVEKYLSVMEKCFHIKRVKTFHRNLEKELVKMPVTYLLDSGMRNVLLNNFSPFVLNPDQGGIWENQVFRILADKYGMDNLRYWRTTDKKEVDFVLPDIIPAKAYEVKINKDSAIFSKYKTFTETYPDIQFSFFCLKPFDEALLKIIE